MVKPPKKLGLVGLLTLGVASLCGGCMADRYLAKAAEKVIGNSKTKQVQERPHAIMLYDPSRDPHNLDQRQLCVWTYLDRNGNGTCDAPEEILSEVIGPVNLEQVGLAAYLDNSKGEVKYASWDSKGNMLGEGVGRGDKYFCTSAGVHEGDFMDGLNGAGEGDFTITAYNEGRTFTKPVTVNHSVSLSNLEETFGQD